jgi:hypothetical protein
MKELFKLTHFVVLFFFVITGNSVYDYVLDGIIAVIAYVYAFKLVGSMSSELGYNSNIMSFVHWTVRTIVSIVMITLVRVLYFGVISVVSIIGESNGEVVSIFICVVLTVFIAEFLKSKTGRYKKCF